jgi:hypothetical protein
MKPIKIGLQGWLSRRTLEWNRLRITSDGLIAIPSYASCREWLGTYVAPHSKVRKESHPGRGEGRLRAGPEPHWYTAGSLDAASSAA